MKTFFKKFFFYLKGAREQLNILSSFVDGTHIYGFNEQRSKQLRSFVGGQLTSTAGPTGRPYLIHGIDGSCRDVTQQTPCFMAGEGRTNENLGLTSLHTLFLRAHNKIAQDLARIRPDWNDETLFLETRRIVIALLQHITFKEFLPAVLGWNTVTLFDLVPLETDAFYNGYNPNVSSHFKNIFYEI